ncbi:DUF58 domain-containing protein [Candidatus Albibeggiatoa sp. nov. NOAA]|uniref:DUF58 domain-containing protein n=1 Tax=Candidatus Albibeggiatoa sp. nov. NOAA TaxID=3162724 RepID=UPI0032F446D1|nr:DUF58 domain-containing protein [Thiotrichaceae bacterium]
MLLPQLDDLLALRHQAQQIGLHTGQRVQTPLSGLYASVFRGQGMDFDEVREYRYGDEIRNIDWRVTARMRKPYLKIYREERERHVVLCVDTSAHMQFGTRGTFKSVQASYAAALLGWSANGHGDKVGGLLFGQPRALFFRPQRSQREFGRLLRQFTEEPKTGHDIVDLPQALTMLSRSTPTGALIFIIADLHQVSTEKLKKALTQIHQQHEVVLIHIVDPADYALPSIGQVNFNNPDNQKVTVNTGLKQGLQRYQQAWQLRQQGLEQLAHQLSVDLISIATNDEVHDSLLAGLRQRMRQEFAHR